MTDDDREVMAYVDREVRAVCEAKQWGHQIRRTWASRGMPVAYSPLGDYEWKLVPGATGHLPQPGQYDFDGTYYVLSIRRDPLSFVLQHDTRHVGINGPHWERETFTVIRPGLPAPRGRFHHAAGWLRDHLLAIIERCAPNDFSKT